MGYFRVKVQKYFKLVVWKSKFEIAYTLIEVLDLIACFLLVFPFSPCTLVMLPVFLFIKLKFESYQFVHYYAYVILYISVMFYIMMKS